MADECDHWKELAAQQGEPESPMCGKCETCLAYIEELVPPEVVYIDVYTRAQAIEDGVLVSLAADPELAQLCIDAGFLAPIAMTREVFMDCVELTPAAKRASNDVKGRLWDILMTAGGAVRTQRLPEVIFSVLVVRDRVRPTLTRLKCVIGPGDDGEPVITIRYPEED